MKLESTLVALTACSNYEQQSLADSINKVLAALNQLPNLHSASVLLKPNLITVKFGSLPCTEADFILAVAHWFLDQGARVSIGDSPVFGTATNALHTLGIGDELTALGVDISNFSQGRNVDLPAGGKAMLANDALDCDLLVNLPRVKAHAQTRLTLAVKNCFGCLVGLRKPWWHMVHGGNNGSFSDRLVQIPMVLPDSITLVDGITAMHITGPINGKPYPLSLLAASTNPVAVDRALHQVLAVPPAKSPLMSACQDAAILGAELSQLSFPLSTPQELQVSDFLVPDTLNPVRFNPFRFLKSTVRRILLSRPRER